MKILSKEKREELVAKIGPLRQQVEAWRKTRQPNEHMPESLWEAATELGKTYGLAPVQGILRIDYRGLQRRVTGVRVPSHSKKPVAGFVELPPMRPTVTGRCEQTVELEDAAGRRMTLKVRGGSLSEVAALVQGFWKPGL
jgi:hypothetical protein